MDFLRHIQAREKPEKVKDFLSSRYDWTVYYFDKLPRHVVPGDLMFIGYAGRVRGFGVVRKIYPPNTYKPSKAHWHQWSVIAGTAHRIQCPYPTVGRPSVPSLDVLETGYRGENKTLARWLKRRAKAFRATASGKREIAAAKANAFDLLSQHANLRLALDKAVEEDA